VASGEWRVARKIATGYSPPTTHHSPLATHHLTAWHDMLDRLRNPLHEITIAVVGKYAKHRDAYKSIYEALDHAGIKHRTKVRAVGVPCGKKFDLTKLESVDGIIVVDGSRPYATGGRIEAVRFARERNIPFFGIDCGMSWTVDEFDENVIDNDGNFVTWAIAQRGTQDVVLAPESKTSTCYDQQNILERFRHRFSFDNEDRERFQNAGLLIAGTSPDGKFVDVIELPSHPWFVAVQFHPEFKSQPTCPHPLFSGFVAAAIVRAQERGA